MGDWVSIRESIGYTSQIEVDKLWKEEVPILTQDSSYPVRVSSCIDPVMKKIQVTTCTRMIYLPENHL